MWFSYFTLNLLSFFHPKTFFPLVSHFMEDLVVLDLQDQVWKLRKQIAQVKKAIKKLFALMVLI